MNLDSVQRIYFVGIGGIGMSATAGLAKSAGFEVSGSDADIYEPSKTILHNYDIGYKLGYNESNLTVADLVITTAAVDESNPEVQRAIRNGIEIASYPELLGQLIKKKRKIVISGTHGKGTTTGMIAYALKNINDSSFFVGAVLNNLKTNFYSGTGPDFVLEGDEYKSNFNDLTPKFLYYEPDVLLINNLELDHPDIYPNLGAIKEVFRTVISNMPRSGIVIYNMDDPVVSGMIQRIQLKKIGFTLQNDPAAQIKARPPVLDGEMFKIEAQYEGGTFVLETHFPGLPYAYDNVAAASVLIALGHKPEEFVDYMKSYAGTRRRYEIVSAPGAPITLIDDYAHHATAIKQTLEATKMKFPGRRIVCFYEPHTYSRTKETLDDLVNSFGSADLVYIAEIYSAREQRLPTTITGQQVVDAVSKKHHDTHFIKDKSEALQKFKENVKPGDVVIVMAVGSFSSLIRDFISAAELIK